MEIRRLRRPAVLAAVAAAGLSALAPQAAPTSGTVTHAAPSSGRTIPATSPAHLNTVISQTVQGRHQLEHLVASTHVTDPIAFFNNTSGVFNFEAPAAEQHGQQPGLHHLRLGRDIVLLGHRAINGGSIQTNGGSVALGGAGSFTVRLGNGPLSLSANTSGLFADAQNTATGTIRANGGQAC